MSESAQGPQSAARAAEHVARWGLPSPPLLRVASCAAWVALASRLVATALPGSHSGIERWILRTDLAAGLTAQLSVLLGSALLIMLVVGTLADRGLGQVHRIVVVPTAAAVLMLVMLSAKNDLEPQASLALGASCLLLSMSGASAALRSPLTRAQGLVLAMVTLGLATRLSARVLSFGATPRDAVWLGRVAWLASAGHAFDGLSVALAAARLRAELRGRAAVVIGVAVIVSLLVAWGAGRGAMDGAKTWQVLAAQALSPLTESPVTFSTMASRNAVEVLAVLLAGAIACWPRAISAGLSSIALALLARPGVDVPVTALVLALAALTAPLGVPFEPGRVLEPLERPRTEPLGANGA